MANLMDYLDWRGDLTLEISPFNEVDALILAELSFVDFDGIVPPPELGRGLPLNEAAEAFFARHGGKDVPMGVLVPDTISKMLRKLMTSPRFRNMTLNGYTALLDDSIEQQFAALTIDLGNGSIYISFRGTDDTIVGWKEDLNMGFLEEIPSQKQAVEYVARVARQYSDKTIRIGGHSKGGNLAAWAAVHLDEKLQRKRLIAAYNNDGPGFSRDLVDTPSYQAVADRLFTYIPASSIVGVLLEHAEDYEVVDSTARSIMQHEPLSWCVEGPRFVHLGQRSQLGQLSDGVLREWIGSMSSREREQFSRAFFDILSRGGRTKTLEDLRSGGLAAGAALIREYAGADEEKKKIISEIFRRLAVDVKDELMKAAGAGVRRAGETILATGQAIADLRK